MKAIRILNIDFKISGKNKQRNKERENAMCDQVTKSKVEIVVNDFVYKGYMFTAWDVTKFLRNSGERISHRDVQDAVKEMWNDACMTDYTRDTKHIGAPVAPFVYYHQNSDVNDYQPDWMENNSNQDGMKNDGVVSTVPANVVVPVAVPVASTATSTEGISSPLVSNSPVRARSITSVVKEVTYEGRLNIPVKMLEVAGFAACTNVTASILNPNIILIENKNPSLNVVASFNIATSNDGRIRLSRTILNKISSCDKFKIERTGAKIVVTPA